MKKYFLSILVILTFSQANTVFAKQKHLTGKVKRIYPFGDRINFKIDGDQCSSSVNNNYYYFSINDPSGKSWYAMLLTAANTKQPISLSMNDADCGLNKNKPVSYVFQDY